MQFCLFSLKHVSDDFSARSIVRLELGIASISCVAFAICHLLTKVGIGACEDPLQAVVVHVRITRPIEPRQPSSHIAGLYLMTMMYREYHNPNPNPTDTGTYQCIKDNPRNRRYSDKISPHGFLYISRSRSRKRIGFTRTKTRHPRQRPILSVVKMNTAHRHRPWAKKRSSSFSSSTSINQQASVS